MFIQELQIGRAQSTLEITSRHLGINGHWREHTIHLLSASLQQSPLLAALICNTLRSMHMASGAFVPRVDPAPLSKGHLPYSRTQEP